VLLAAFRKIRVDGKSLARATEKTPIGSLGLDSLGLLDMVVHVEEISGVTLPDTVLSKVRTVGELLDVVERRRSR
jgi:acyl carrier protein